MSTDSSVSSFRCQTSRCSALSRYPCYCALVCPPVVREPVWSGLSPFASARAVPSPRMWHRVCLGVFLRGLSLLMFISFCMLSTFPTSILIIVVLSLCSESPNHCHIWGWLQYLLRLLRLPSALTCLVTWCCNVATKPECTGGPVPPGDGLCSPRGVQGSWGLELLLPPPGGPGRAGRGRLSP